MIAPDELERAVERLLDHADSVDRFGSGGIVHPVDTDDLRLLLSERAELLATVERMREALMAAQSFIADGGLAEDVVGASIYCQVTAALTTGEEK